MREIKFRAWDIGMGEMFHNVTTLNAESGTYMQYTGLKDKNCREIYEGDIVDVESERCPFDKNRTGIVKMIDGSWLLEDLEGTNGEYLFNETLEVEVIGNVHENRELLGEIK